MADMRHDKHVDDVWRIPQAPREKDAGGDLVLPKLALNVIAERRRQRHRRAPAPHPWKVPAAVTKFDEAGWNKIINLMKVVPGSGVYPGANAKVTRMTYNRKGTSRPMCAGARPRRLPNEVQGPSAADRRMRSI